MNTDRHGFFSEWSFCPVFNPSFFRIIVGIEVCPRSIKVVSNAFM
ncbi:MAG: hypothetical protein SGI98_04375 [Verrucomicrobiota bacterium]|nr:hypothetical protein [Verrucomicrobiota bacterium]